jgi:hypothetical protein
MMPYGLAREADVMKRFPKSLERSPIGIDRAALDQAVREVTTRKERAQGGIIWAPTLAAIRARYHQIAEAR